jgi:hypothetical protein
VVSLFKTFHPSGTVGFFRIVAVRRDAGLHRVGGLLGINGFVCVACRRRMGRRRRSGS